MFLFFFHNYETNFSTLLLIKNAIHSPLLRISVSGLLREKNLKNCSKIFFVSCMYVLRLLSDCRNVLKCQTVVDLDTNARWAAPDRLLGLRPAPPWGGRSLLLSRLLSLFRALTLLRVRGLCVLKFIRYIPVPLQRSCYFISYYTHISLILVIKCYVK